MRKIGKVLAAAMSLVMVLGSIMIPGDIVSAKEKTASEQYVAAMGTGFNLGNSFDSFDRINNVEIDDETAWGNPVVTKEYIDAMKAKGFKSIRIPFTAFTRIGDNYQINPVFLQRYEDVVNYALDAGFYVMVNLHHDSSEWLKYWDGNLSSEQYTKFVSLWTQLAERFKDYGDRVMFESANEVYFESASGDAGQNQRVAAINQAFYDVVRSSGGNNATRMLVLPTSYTNHGLVYSQYLTDFIKGLNDKNIIATVHYYSTSLYAFTINAGVPEFDQEYRGMTGRTAIDDFYDALEATFTANGIGVIIGEYGLFNMGTPKSLEDGEMIKFFDYMNYRGNHLGMCTMLWDNGGIVNRNTGEFYNPIWGEVIQTSMTDRSSYATGLDNVFVTSSTADNDIRIPLTLNGNSLTAIYNGSTLLTEGNEYTYSNETVTLSGSYISSLITGDYGVKADLRFVFTAGSDWHQYINYTGTATMEAVNAPIRTDDGFMARYDTDGTPTYPTTIIPMDYNGKIIKRIASYDASGNPKSSNSWASDYMQCGSEYVAAYEEGLLCIMNWHNDAISDGTYTLVIDFYDGTSMKYSLTKANGSVKGQPITTPGGEDNNNDADYTFVITNDWNTGCQAALTVTNTTGTDFTNGWTLAFDFGREITNVFDANLISSENGSYVVSNTEWKPVLKAGESVTINFLAGAGSKDAKVTNCAFK